LKRRHAAIWREQGPASLAEWAAIREEIRSLIEAAGESAILKSIDGEISATDGSHRSDRPPLVQFRPISCA